MKKITLFLFALFSCWQINAQVSSYSFSETTETYAQITGTTSTATGDDGTQTNIPIGFTFNFGGTDYTAFGITTNGIIRLGTNTTNTTISSGWTNELSNTSTNRPLIAPFWDDNNMSGGEIRYSVTGTAPNQVLTINWHNSKIGSTGSTLGSTVSTLLRLYETTNVIEIVYSSPFTTTNSVTASVGLNDTSSFLSVTPAATSTFSNSTANNLIGATEMANLAGKKLIFTPPPPCSGIPVGGTVSPANQTLLSGQVPATLSITGQTTGASNLAFQWEESTNGTDWVNSTGGTGATTLAYTPPTFSGTMIMYRLRITCTASAESSVSTVATVSPCGALPVPALEILDTFLPTCWQEADNGDLTAGPATFLSGAWVADGFGNQGTNGAARILIDGASDNDWIITPLYAIPSTGFELKYDAAATQSGLTTNPTTPWEADDFVEVLVSTGFTNWTVLYTYNAANANIPLNTGTPNVINLDAYAGQNIRFAFRAVEGVDNGSASIDFSIDNIQIRETPPCVEPTLLTAINPTSSSIDLSWTPGGTELDWEYVVQPQGTGVPTGSGNAIDTNMFTESGLQVNTAYEVYVRSFCDVTEQSPWVGPVNFRTLCETVTDFTQNFDTVTTPAMPDCWSKVSATGSSYTQTGSPNSGPNTLYLYSSSGTSLAVVSMTPVSNLGSGTHRLRFNMRGNFSTGGVVEFGYLTDPTDATSFTLISSVAAASTTYQQYAITPVAGTYSNYPAFRHTGVPANSVLIDDVVWEQIPLLPVCSTISSPADDAVDVAITANISWDANIDAIGYRLKIGTTSGGSEVLVETDLGNVLTYNPPVDFNYSTVYYVTLTPYSANGSASGCLETTFTTRAMPPVGSVCSDPIVINAATLPFTTTDNTNLYGDDYENGSSPCTAYYMSGDDVVYAITPVSDISVDIMLSDLGGTWSGIHVLDGCPDETTPPNCVAFEGDSGSADRDLQDVLLTGGVTYYIVISTWATPQSVSYTLTITENTCVNPTATFSTTSNCPTTTFNAIANISDLGSATSLTVTDNQGSLPQNVTAVGNVSFGPYALGTNVVLTVTNDQDSSCNILSSNLTILACPPANDDCVNAQVLTPGGVFGVNDIVGTNLGALASNGETAPDCAQYVGGDVWYSAVVPASGNLTFELNTDSGGITDGAGAVYSGSCGALVLIDCDDSSSSDPNDQPLISVTGRTPGEVLYFRVWEYGNNVFGTFLVSAYDASLSSDSFDNNNFLAYPNPVKDVFNLSYSSEISSVKVINLLGQEVLTRTVNATSTQIDMSQLSAGTYIVNATVGDTVKIIKIVKQ
ncbi:T9SS type A sorting domain-containing protein [Flavobacterium cucumis]|uniref:Por secretion system C-terminal sorting domain-containing protein n=1 Tax=Flavobacterium cucumis TaxID=416016 RepID=A0A1M7ZVK6_9FLAO|nr:T9SS type A sorting domain-containing protein [Flavobacterium cucumis]SHO72919.1 Por secretion system C-terminal sorting domain-containing protein [Flavobacterium cucumis]